jgi:hypothetical protein
VGYQQTPSSGLAFENLCSRWTMIIAYQRWFSLNHIKTNFLAAVSYIMKLLVQAHCSKALATMEERPCSLLRVSSLFKPSICILD